MLKAKEIMTREVITVSPGMKVAEVVQILLEKRINGLPVVDEEGELVGIICQSDLIVQQKKIPLPSIFTLLDSFISLSSSRNMDVEIEKIAATTVAQAMTKNPVAVHPETTLEEIATLMVEKNYHTVPVVEGGKLVGIVGKEDVLRTLVSKR
jgi:CBS domain-containing protein